MPKGQEPKFRTEVVYMVTRSRLSKLYKESTGTEPTKEQLDGFSDHIYKELAATYEEQTQRFIAEESQ